MKNFDLFKRRSKKKLSQDDLGFDLDNITSIEAIPIPKYSKLSGAGSPINNIEYILQRKATEHKRNNRMDLAIACLRKANQIFPHSNFLWSKKDYLRLIDFLKQDGQFEEARIEERKINQYFNENDLNVLVYKKTLSDCKSMKTDLIVTSDIFRTCGECAKYAKRIFSISGKDKRFPVFPHYFGLQLQEHAYCINSFHPFFLEYSEPHWHYKGTLIEWSNRPFIDERSKEQKKDFKDRVVNNLQEIIDRKNYDILLEHFKEIAPKSFAGFRRMKNMQSKNYLLLVETCRNQGVNLDEKLDLSIYHF